MLWKVYLQIWESLKKDSKNGLILKNVIVIKERSGLTIYSLGKEVKIRVDKDDT
jgi:hypothetical protein